MATKTQTVRARVEPKLKKDAEEVLHKIGLTSSEAVELFLRRVTLVRGLPFEMRVPNKKTRKAITDMRSGKGVKTANFAEFARMVRAIK